MGIGVWYEMYVSDTLAYLYKNVDPHGSLRANVSNAAVRCLSNMKLERMLEERHSMSRSVREEVSEKSREWGYQIGSVYIRKVTFSRHRMIAQIEQKVVNRLRQVTGAIQQDGQNRVNVIRSRRSNKPPASSPERRRCAPALSVQRSRAWRRIASCVTRSSRCWKSSAYRQETRSYASAQSSQLLGELEVARRIASRPR